LKQVPKIETKWLNPRVAPHHSSAISKEFDREEYLGLALDILL